MDSSSRLSFLLGDLRVSAKEITPKEWTRIVYKIHDATKHCFKYAGTKPIGELLKSAIVHGATLETPATMIARSDDIFLRTRALVLYVERTTPGQTQDNLLVPAHYLGLFLLENGRYVQWKGKYRVSKVSSKEQAMSCELIELSWTDGIEEFFAEPYQYRGYHMLDSLYLKFMSLVRDREEQLNTFKRIAALTEGMKFRVNP
ncbi:MAG TPA: hypothetical protein VMT99_02420 [Candidatus Paceibacterota bacterium]|nr:hypothetical protein [Candidatus Paceibacterota bacterium]